ncbi:MAG: hypothetical protein ACR2PU_03885 [Gammaproteobacteria bacterium]
MKCNYFKIFPLASFLLFLCGMIILDSSSKISIIETVEARAGRAATANRAAVVGRRSVVRSNRLDNRYDNRRRARVRAGTRVVVLPSNCRTIISSRIKYYYCGGYYYRPYYYGTELVYIIVEDPT